MDRNQFESDINGIKTGLYKLVNENGMSVHITNYGARVVSMIVPDKNGKFEDVVLGFDHLSHYLHSEERYYGAMVGRYCNRIAHAKYTLDGNTIQLEANHGTHILHGGQFGFHDKVWNVIKKGENILELSALSKAGESGFPGNVHIKLSFIVSDLNELIIQYEANTDAPTPFNVCHHSYFNLKGAGNGTILDHYLRIHADAYTPLDKAQIPTGEIKSVEDTPFNFRAWRQIGEQKELFNAHFKNQEGFDQNFVLRTNTSDLHLAAEVFEKNSGRKLDIYTTEPGIQFYTANGLSGKDIGKMNKSYKPLESFCLETQHFPDSPNHKNFPSAILMPGNTYHSETIYKFSSMKDLKGAIK